MIKYKVDRLDKYNNKITIELNGDKEVIFVNEFNGIVLYLRPKDVENYQLVSLTGEMKILNGMFKGESVYLEPESEEIFFNGLGEKVNLQYNSGDNTFRLKILDKVYEFL